jgi:hypothetical protein
VSPAGNPRDQKFMITFTEDEKNALLEMALEDSLPAATWLRQLMMKEHRKRDAERAAATSPKQRKPSSTQKTKR